MGGVDERVAEAKVEGNSRLTAATGAVLVVLLAAEGLTILRVRALLTPHVFLGMLLVPPVLLKTATTGYRFVRYYRGDPAYRRKGPPPPILRLLGPFVVLSTVAVLVTGVWLLLAPPSMRHELLFLHKVTFVLWFGTMTIHVIGHAMETARLAPLDWYRATRRDVTGASTRQWALVTAVVVGVPLGLLLLDRVGPWLRATPHPLGG